MSCAVVANAAFDTPPAPLCGREACFEAKEVGQEKKHIAADE